MHRRCSLSSVVSRCSHQRHVLRSWLSCVLGVPSEDESLEPLMWNTRAFAALLSFVAASLTFAALLLTASTLVALSGPLVAAATLVALHRRIR